MKKSELKQLIREVLHEELLRESDDGKGKQFDEDGFLSHLPNGLKPLAGLHLVSKSKGEAIGKVATLPDDFSALETKVYSADKKNTFGEKVTARCYYYVVGKDLPADIGLSKELQQALNKVNDFYANNEQATIKVFFKPVTRGDNVDVWLVTEATPKEGYSIKIANWLHTN